MCKNRDPINLAILVFFVTILGCVLENYALVAAFDVFSRYTIECRVALVDFGDSSIPVQKCMWQLQILTMELMLGTNNIDAEQDSQILGWCTENVIVKDIYGTTGLEFSVMQLLSMMRIFVLSGFSFNLFLFIQSQTEKGGLNTCVEFLKLVVLKELYTCVSSSYSWCLISCWSLLGSIHNKQNCSQH